MTNLSPWIILHLEFSVERASKFLTCYCGLVLACEYWIYCHLQVCVSWLTHHIDVFIRDVFRVPLKWKKDFLSVSYTHQFILNLGPILPSTAKLTTSLCCVCKHVWHTENTQSWVIYTIIYIYKVIGKLWLIVKLDYWTPLIEMSFARLTELLSFSSKVYKNI